MKKIIIAAMTNDRVIGKDGDIPWHYPEDLKHFKEKTMGNPVVMGRKTFQSLPESFRPLPGRKNIVLTRSNPDLPDEVEKASNLEEAWSIAQKHGKKAFIIGGANIYRQTLNEADEMIITEVKESYEGDTFFPEWNKDNWKEVSREERENLEFVRYQRS